MSRRARRMRGAFTLFEVLVSVGLIVVLVAAMSAFLGDALRIRARVSDSLSRGLSAEAAIAEIESALQTCVVDDAALGVGVRGDSLRLIVLRSGLSAWRLGGAEARRALEPVERVQFEFRADRRRIAMARGESEPSELPGDIYDVRFRYFDGRAWVDNFDSGELGRLPAAVEVSVWFEEPRGAPVARERPETDDDVAASEPEAPPDRRRVIAIPDAHGDDEGGTP
ncbi:MAG: hypothetical protein U0572_07340 [Phycisphaerales bacterium]